MIYYRIAIALLSFMTFGLSFQPAARADSEKFHGRVFFDRNGNGKIDQDEPGIKNVRVTDGIQHIFTDANGNYQLQLTKDPVLPHARTRTISVCWPNQTWPTTRWWRRIADLDGNRVDFGLRPDKQSLPITFAHATDPHNNFVGAINENWRKEIASLGNQVNLCFITGDLGYMGIKNADRDFHSIQQYTEKFPVPMFHTVGNHDIVGIHTTQWNKPTELHGNGAYTKYLGPIRWSFNYAGIHFVGMDWAYIEKDKKMQNGGISKEAARWLDNDLRLAGKNRRIYVFIHSAYDKTNRLWPILQRHKVEMVVAGHSHRNFQKSVNGIPYINTMNLNGPYKLISVRKKGYQIVHRCMSCRGRWQADGKPYHRTRNFSYPTTGVCRVIVPSLTIARRKDHYQVKGIRLDTTPYVAKKINAAKRFELELNIDPGKAKNYGVRLRSGKEKLEIVLTNRKLRCGDFTTDNGRTKKQKSWHLDLVVEDGEIFVRVNYHVGMKRAFALKAPVRVSLIAEGGTATVLRLDHWALQKATKYKN